MAIGFEIAIFDAQPPLAAGPSPERPDSTDNERTEAL
jgi:hypothetical protein